MKILINSINYAPELVGIGKYTSEMADWLTEAGHEVKVVTAPPYYPEWKVSDGFSSVRYKSELVNNTRVIRCPLWVPAKPSGIKRVVHLASFAFTTFPIMIWQGIFWRPDIVFVVEPPLLCAPGALISASLARARSWLHIQDFEVDAAFDLGMLKSKRLRYWVTKAECWLMKKFDRVSTISVRMLERVIKKGVPVESTKLFENWVDTELIFPISERAGLYQEFGLPNDRTIVLYSGNMGEKQGLEIIVEVARLLEPQMSALFIMCGTGSAKKRLMDLAQDIDNIVFFPLQPVEKLNELLNIADIHLLPQKADAEDLVMPSKLTNMMASGRPVVATVAKGSQIANVLDGCGIVVDPENTAALCTAIKDLVNDPTKADMFGHNCRKFTEKHWNKDNVLSKVFSRKFLF